MGPTSAGISTIPDLSAATKIDVGGCEPTHIMRIINLRADGQQDAPEN